MIDRKNAADSRSNQQKSATASPTAASASAIDEINAYIAVRDSQLAEAEKEVTLKSLLRIELANTFVENCLKPACSPYEAQNFPETSARFERKRCEVIKNRIAELRAIAASKAQQHAA